MKEYQVTHGSRINPEKCTVYGNNDHFNCPFCGGIVPISTFKFGSTNIPNICTCNKCQEKFTINR